jgi:hypothetical protein
MIEFTKGELLNILRLINSYEMVLTHHDMTFHKDEIILQNKLQSMIDNYCEHEFYACGQNAFPICYKCGLIPRFNND